MAQDLYAGGFSLQRSINKIPRALVYAAAALPGIWVFYLAVENKLGADPCGGELPRRGQFFAGEVRRVSAATVT